MHEPMFVLFNILQVYTTKWVLRSLRACKPRHLTAMCGNIICGDSEDFIGMAIGIPLSALWVNPPRGGLTYRLFIPPRGGLTYMLFNPARRA